MPQLTYEQRINTILHLEGMPEELPLLVDQEGYHRVEDSDDDLPDGDGISAHDVVIQALNLDNATPVDTFIESQSEHEYRWKDDNKEVAQ